MGPGPVYCGDLTEGVRCRDAHRSKAGRVASRRLCEAVLRRAGGSFFCGCVLRESDSGSSISVNGMDTAAQVHTV